MEQRDDAGFEGLGIAGVEPYLPSIRGRAWMTTLYKRSVAGREVSTKPGGKRAFKFIDYDRGTALDRCPLEHGQ